jgi:hypothetical protein
MSKQATIASLIRQAAKTEADFCTVSTSLIGEGDMERTAEFFDRLNIPRSLAAEFTAGPLIELGDEALLISNFQEEQLISNGMQKFLTRHIRKIRWHSTHPGMEGISNVLFLTRVVMTTTTLRLRRVLALLQTKDELTPQEWAISRELMNRSFLGFRNFLHHMGSVWIDSMMQTVPHDEFAEQLGDFYELIDLNVRELEEHRTLIETRRTELTVIPEGYDPVKPPHYFGGDLLEQGPWSQYWRQVNKHAHHFREALA